MCRDEGGAEWWRLGKFLSELCTPPPPPSQPASVLAVKPLHPRLHSTLQAAGVSTVSVTMALGTEDRLAMTLDDLVAKNTRSKGGRKAPGQLSGRTGVNKGSDRRQAPIRPRAGPQNGSHAAARRGAARQPARRSRCGSLPPLGAINSECRPVCKTGPRGWPMQPC